MHAAQLAQIATQFALVGHPLTAESAGAIGQSAHGYWLAHRFRCDAWHKKMTAHRQAIERCGTSQRERRWREVIPTLHEVLFSEPLTRVIAYLAQVLEVRGADADWGPLAQSTLANQIEARHRCLNLMVFGYGLPVERAVGLNRLRRLLEFFSDQLLCALPGMADLDHYAFEPAFVAASQKEYRRYPVSGTIQQIRLRALSSSLNQSARLDPPLPSANACFNQNIAEAALAMLPPQIFDSFGLVRGQLSQTVSGDVNEGPAATGDFNVPLASPFDLLSTDAIRRSPKTSRRF